MIDYQRFLQTLNDSPLQEWAQQLPEQIKSGLDAKRYGDLPRWQEALAALPELKVSQRQLNSARVGADGDITPQQQAQLRDALMGLHPWRKGPYEVFGVHIDTEWHSDWKWDRVEHAIAPLQDRLVLDVGCGSGYHCWRMRGAGASCVVGIDPTPLFVLQYFALQKYLQDSAVAVLPLGIEQLPSKLAAFDTTFSMGILYHRRSPIDHLYALRDTLRSSGQLVLETLVIDGKKGDCLVPDGRYSKMGNVWFIPSTASLEGWLAKVGFRNIQLIDVNQTSIEEQRSTEWMRFHSLTNFLDPHDSNKTIEGYPAPKRAVFIAEAP